VFCPTGVRTPTDKVDHLMVISPVPKSRREFATVNYTVALALHRSGQVQGSHAPLGQKSLTLDPPQTSVLSTSFLLVNDVQHEVRPSRQVIACVVRTTYSQVLRSTQPSLPDCMWPSALPLLQKWHKGAYTIDC